MAKLQSFEVVRTPKLKDSENNYVYRGEICKLDKTLAEHYHALGYIKVTMDDLFNDKEPDTGANASPDGAQDDGGPIDAKPAAGVVTDDGSKAGDDAENDAGAGKAEAPSRRPINSRRKRVTG